METNETALLGEIRDLLREQNAMIAEMKALNAEAAARSMLAVDRAEGAFARNEDVLRREKRKTLIAFLIFMAIMAVVIFGEFHTASRMLGL